MLHDHLCENGWMQNLVAHCVYCRHAGDETVILIIWVADVIIATNTEDSFSKVKQIQNAQEIKLKIT